MLESCYLWPKSFDEVVEFPFEMFICLDVDRFGTKLGLSRPYPKDFPCMSSPNDPKFQIE